MRGGWYEGKREEFSGIYITAFAQSPKNKKWFYYSNRQGTESFSFDVGLSVRVTC